MYKKSHFVLAFFTFFIMYLFYKIIAFKIEEFQIANYTATLENKNQEVEDRIDRKENFEKYIHTNAYRTQIAKATQNKNLPWEEIINVISQSEIDGNAKLETEEVLAKIQEKQNDPTLTMSNPERWHYIFKNGIKKK